MTQFFSLGVISALMDWVDLKFLLKSGVTATVFWVENDLCLFKEIATTAGTTATEFPGKWYLILASAMAITGGSEGVGIIFTKLGLRDPKEELNI